MPEFRLNARKPKNIGAGLATPKGEMYLLYREDIKSMPARNDKGVLCQGDIILKSGRRFHLLYLTPSTQKRNIKSEGEIDSRGWKKKATGNYPGDQLEIHEFLRININQGFVIIMNSYDDVYQRIYGSIENPLYFTGEFNDDSDKKGYELTFEQNFADKDPVLFYNGKILLDESVIEDPDLNFDGLFARRDATNLTDEEVNGWVSLFNDVFVNEDQLQEFKKEVVSDIRGEATPTSSPTLYVPADFPNGLFEKWDIKTAGNYTNFKDASLPIPQPIVVTSDDLKNNYVQIWVTNAVSEKVLKAMPVANLSITSFTGSAFPLVSTVEHPVQRTYNGSTYELTAGQTASSADLPGVSDKWQLISSDSKIKKDVGFEEIAVGTNLISELVGSDPNNTELWLDGYINAAGGISGTGGAWRHTKKLYDIQPVLSDFRLGIYSNACIAFYDANKVLILSYKTPNNSSSVYYQAAYQPPANTRHFKLSHFMTSYNTANIYVKNTLPFYKLTDKVFVLSGEVDNKIESKVQNITGAEIYPAGTNIIAELTGSALTNTELWTEGFLNSLGNVQAGSGWHCTKKYYKPRKGTYAPLLLFSGNAKAIIYTAPGIVKEVITNASGAFTTPLTFTGNELIRFSHSGTSTNTISLLNTTPLNPVFITADNIAAYAPQSGNKAIRKMYLDQYQARRKRPLITIIADDGQPHNLEWFVPMLDEFKVKATFAMIGSRILAADNGTGTVSITSAQTRALYLAGHDIASHTWSHTSQWSTALTLDQIDEEMSRNKVFLERITEDSVNMFISPFGLRSPEIDNILSRYYDTNFISDIGKSVTLPLDNYFIYRTSFDADDANPSLNWESTLKPAIDDAMANNKWLIFAIHPQYTQYNSWVNKEARKNELRTLLQYCKDNNIEITTAKKAYNYYKNHVDIGVKRVDLSYYKLAMDMTEENVNYFE